MNSETDNLIHFLKKRQSATLGNLRIAYISKLQYEITGFSKFLYIENIDKQTAMDEMEEIKHLFAELLKANEKLRLFFKAAHFKYTLVYDDAGRVGIYICSESRNGLQINPAITK